MINDTLECINKCNSNYLYEYKGICYKSYIKRTKCTYTNSRYLCQDLNCNLYYNYEQDDCYDSIPDGYYLNDSNLKTIDKCNIKCKTCNFESNSNNSCLICNNAQHYYQKLNNNNKYINCYNELPYDYVLDNNIYKPCFDTCDNCTEIGDEYNNKCTKCKTNFIFKTDFDNDKNCYQICDYYYYFDSNRRYHCTSQKKCPNEYNKLINNKNKCVETCKEDSIYKFEYKNICYKSCPQGTHNSSNSNYICEEDLVCEYYYNYTRTGCLDIIPEGYYLNDSILKTIDKCDRKCKNCSIESNLNNLCISCNNKNNYYKKYNDILNINSFINCYNQLPNGYYFDNNEYKPCFQTCMKCNESGNENNNKCTLCKLNYTFKNDYENDNNCYKECQFYYYFDINKKYHCTINDKCPEEYNILIKEKNKCIDSCPNDNKYKYEYNNSCYESCPEGTNFSSENHYICEIKKTSKISNKNEISEFVEECNINEFFKGLCDIKSNTPEIIDDYISMIKNNIFKSENNSLVLNLTDEGKNDLVIQYNKVKYHITSTFNQKNNTYENISVIRLGECENILYKYYNISEENPLIILKMDIYEEGLLIPLIEYEIYNPETMEQLDLNLCYHTKVNIFLPVLTDIKEEDEFKYNSSSDHHNNIRHS